MREEFTRLTDALGRTYAGVDPAIAQTEIDEAVRLARKTRATRERTPKKAKR